jgi:hypothetical protein
VNEASLFQTQFGAWRAATEHTAEKNREWTGKTTCKSVESADNQKNHQKGSRRSWVRNQMGNVSSGLLQRFSFMLKRNQIVLNNVFRPKQPRPVDAEKIIHDWFSLTGWSGGENL